MKPNLIKCEVQKYQRYLTEQELAELKRASQEATVILKAHYSEKYAADQAKEAENEKGA